ncbi:MAG: endonuclease domain-containing protein [Anaerolineales bacterium]
MHPHPPFPLRGPSAGTLPKSTIKSWDINQLSGCGFGEGWGWGRIVQCRRREQIPRSYERARQLRKELTPAEKKLWAYLRGDKLNGVSFRRQHAIGNFTSTSSVQASLIFVSINRKLIIELDGSQHIEQAEYDVERSKYFESQGYKVIPQGDDVRFWNYQ